MTDPTRRHVLSATTTAAGLVATLAAPGGPAAADEPAKNKEPRTDRAFVIASGMTEGEADCWELAAKTAGAFFALPELHAMDRQEVASAIHVIQNKLLSRPTYRHYLEVAKKARGQSPK